MLQEMFFQELDLRYPERCTLMEDVLRNGDRIGKIHIPLLMPNIPGGEPRDQQLPLASRNNVINDDDIGLVPITESNYLTVKIPYHLFPYTGGCVCPDFVLHEGHNPKCAHCEQKYNESKLVKGTTLIIVFIGGRVDDIRVIGVEEG